MLISTYETYQKLNRSKGKAFCLAECTSTQGLNWFIKPPHMQPEIHRHTSF